MACTDYAEINVSLLEQAAFRDAVICAYGDQLTVPIFAAMVVLGVFNLPIYIRQDSVLVPFAITLVIGGVIISSVASMLQSIMITLLLFVFGLGPVLVLRRVMA